MNVLDKQGLSKYTQKVNEAINNKIQLASKNDYVYNGNLLTKKFKRNFSMLVLGDNIGGGTGSPNSYGFIQMLQSTSDNLCSAKKYEFWNYYYSSRNGWNNESTDFSLELISSTDQAEDLIWDKNGWIVPHHDYEIIIVYGVNTDGGEFDVLDSDNNVLATINCKGEKVTRKFSQRIKVKADKYFIVRPKQGNKAYVNSVLIDYTPSVDGNLIFNYSISGRRLID